MTIDPTTEATEPVETSTELLARARAAGVRVKLLGMGQPQFRSPPEALPLVQELRQRRDEVLELLRIEAAQLDALHRIGAAAQALHQRDHHRPGRPAQAPQRQLPFRRGGRGR